MARTRRTGLPVDSSGAAPAVAAFGGGGSAGGHPQDSRTGAGFTGVKGACNGWRKQFGPEQGA